MRPPLTVSLFALLMTLPASAESEKSTSVGMRNVTPEIKEELEKETKGALREDASEATTEAASISEPSDAYIETISVYATRNPLPAFDYAGQVSVIERSQILDFNPSTLQDIFQAIPGTTFDSGPRRTGDAPTIRGLTGNGVLIFLDGARQSFVSGHDGRFFVDPELVQSVEVVRGPTSALYGSGALGGVIATKTITARDYLDEGETAAIRVHSGFQSVNDEYRVGYTGAWQSQSGLVDLVSHFTFRQSGDIALGNGLDLPADDDIASTLIKGTVRPNDSLELSASYIRYNADSTDPQNPQGGTVAGPGNELVFRDANSETFQGSVNWNPASNWINFNLVAYYTDNSVEEDEVETPRTTDRIVETFGVLIDNRSHFELNTDTRLTLTYGAEYYQDQQTGTDTETIDGTRGGVPDATTDFYGAFIQAELRVQEPLGLPGEASLIPGIRWDRFDSSEPGGTFDIDAENVSPKVGLTYKPISEFLLFANYAVGFRAPSFNEAFADGVHFAIPNLSAPPGPFGPSFVSNLFIGNTELEPEESQTWEVGAGLDLDGIFEADDSFQVKGSYYTSSVDNLIGLDVTTPLGCFTPALAFVQPCGTGAAFGNTSQNINIANATISGVEIEFSYNSEYFYSRGNFSAINGRDDDTGAFLEGTLSANTLFVDSGIKYDPLGIRLGGRLTVAADFDDVNSPQDARDGFVFGDIYAVWEHAVTERLQLRLDLGIDNLTDTNFEVVNAGVSQPGRNFKAALAFRYSL